MESTVTDKENVLPSFGSTLSQLTAEEARYLDKLWSAVIRRNPLPNEPYRLKRNQFDFNFMQFVFDPELSEDAGKYKTKRFFKEQPSAKEIEAFGRQDKLRLMVQDLERLGIIGSRSELHQGQSDWVEVESKEIEIPGDSVLHQWTSFTPYGKSFINAVKPKITSSK